MSDEISDFVIGSPRENSVEPTKENFDLQYAYPYVEKINDSSVVQISSGRKFKSKSENDSDVESPLTNNIIKPYPTSELVAPMSKLSKNFTGKLVEIAVRDVIINDTSTSSSVKSVAVLFRDKLVCRMNPPFNRQLYKFLTKTSTDVNDFSMKVCLQNAFSTKLPIPFPEYYVDSQRTDIDFSFVNKSGISQSGVVICTISLKIPRSVLGKEQSTFFNHEPEEPGNSGSLISRWESSTNIQNTSYFLLEDPLLRFEGGPTARNVEDRRKKMPKLLDIAVLEQTFSLMDLSFDWLQSEHSLRVSSNSNTFKNRRQLLTVNVLRGIQVPVREESALVQPMIEIEWCNSVFATPAADGPAPVWQQTFQFEVSKLNEDKCLKLRLFDQHPVWGLQWLGEARMPLECRYHYQEVERWVDLSIYHSPKHLFGYVQASPGFSHTRIYVLVKMHQTGILDTVDEASLDGLSKGVQRCLAVPYRVDQLVEPELVAKLVTLIGPLVGEYGPLRPKQALGLNKVDYYGRAALLASLLRGLGLRCYVLLGTSQIMRIAAYCLTVDDNLLPFLWDPETGEHYDLTDSHCSLINVLRLIDHKTVWDNTQKSLAPSLLKFDPKNTRDWQPLIINSATNDDQPTQTLNFTTVEHETEEEKNQQEQIEDFLKNSLTNWREELDLPTIFNFQADSTLHEFMIENDENPPGSQFDKKKMRQLYRSFYIHGFIAILRYTDLEDLKELLFSTKCHQVLGPVEFSLTCHVQRFLGKIKCVWLGLLILRSRE